MKRYLLLSSSLALGATVAGTAMADVTAADVWGNQQAYLGSLGLRANGTLEGDTLHALEINAVFPMGLGSFQILGPDISLVENGNGTVTITYPSPFDVTISGFIKDAGQFSAELHLTHDIYQSVASGNAGDITYESNLENLRMELRDFTFPESDGLDVAGVVTLDSWAGVNHITEGNLISVESDSRVGPTAVQFILTEPSGMITTTDQTTQPMTSKFSGTLPVGGSNLLNLSSAIRDGLAMTFESTGGGSASQTIVMMDGELSSQQDTHYGPQTAQGSLSESGLVVEAEAKDMTIVMQQDMLFPAPVEFSVGALSAIYDIPVNASDEVQDFRLALNMNNIALADDLWAMFDPTNQLPRDPADIELDINGEGTTGFDILDFIGWAGLQSAPPIEIDTVTLSNLHISAAGAEATAEGTVTFDWTDFTTIAGIARPEGAVEINVTGANALMDSLTAMGLLSDEDVTGARMMMGIFAEPTGDDALKSVLEINDQGQILANGQRIR